MKQSRYMDRAMRSRDPRFRRVLGRLGHEPTIPVTDNEIIHGPRGSIATADAIPPDDGGLEYIDAINAPAVPAPGEEQASEDKAKPKPAKTETPAKSEKPARKPRTGKAKRGTYKRRDMKAED